MAKTTLFVPCLLLPLLAACGEDPEREAPAADTKKDDVRAAGVTGQLNAPQASLDSVTVRLAPQPGVGGPQRVNFAVPLAPSMLFDAARVRVFAGGVELPRAERGLARYPEDQSLRSVQIQVDVDPSETPLLEVRIGEDAQVTALSRVPVEDTLMSPDGTEGPRVYALLPAAWLSRSGVTGPELPEEDLAGTRYEAWSNVCDYDRYGLDRFLSHRDNGTVWLYDRGSTYYRGYARRGDLRTLETAYRETAIYRDGLSGAGAELRVPVPTRERDLRYHYTQNMAIHYLLTGDDRFREAAEVIAERVNGMWSPWYGGEDYGDGYESWTERHAGFALLAQVWAMAVSDDRADEFRANADEHVNAYLHVQASYPAGYDDETTRCFAHHAIVHAERWGYFGCSPWMSAILADALDAYAAERGGDEGAAARSSLVSLGRMLAREGRDPSTGRPYYWMGVDVDRDERDDMDEHWGEAAYVIAMAYHHDGKRDPALKEAAEELIEGLSAHGEAPHMRSFNWQCRSAVAAPWYLLH